MLAAALRDMDGKSESGATIAAGEFWFRFVFLPGRRYRAFRSLPRPSDDMDGFRRLNREMRTAEPNGKFLHSQFGRQAPYVTNSK